MAVAKSAKKAAATKASQQEAGDSLLTAQTADNKAGITTTAGAGVAVGNVIQITRDGQTFDAHVTAVHPAKTGEGGLVYPMRIDVMANTGNPAMGGRERIEGITVGQMPAYEAPEPVEVPESATQPTTTTTVTTSPAMSEEEKAKLEEERQISADAAAATLKANEESAPDGKAE